METVHSAAWSLACITRSETLCQSAVSAGAFEVCKQLLNTHGAPVCGSLAAFAANVAQIPALRVKLISEFGSDVWQQLITIDSAHASPLIATTIATLVSDHHVASLLCVAPGFEVISRLCLSLDKAVMEVTCAAFSTIFTTDSLLSQLLADEAGLRATLSTAMTTFEPLISLGLTVISAAIAVDEVRTKLLACGLINVLTRCNDPKKPGAVQQSAQSIMAALQKYGVDTTYVAPATKISDQDLAATTKPRTAVKNSSSPIAAVPSATTTRTLASTAPLSQTAKSVQSVSFDAAPDDSLSATPEELIKSLRQRVATAQRQCTAARKELQTMRETFEQLQMQSDAQQAEIARLNELLVAKDVNTQHELNTQREMFAATKSALEQSLVKEAARNENTQKYLDTARVMIHTTSSDTVMEERTQLQTSLAAAESSIQDLRLLNIKQEHELADKQREIERLTKAHVRELEALNAKYETDMAECKAADAAVRTALREEMHSYEESALQHERIAQQAQAQLAECETKLTAAQAALNKSSATLETQTDLWDFDALSADIKQQLADERKRCMAAVSKNTVLLLEKEELQTQLEQSKCERTTLKQTLSKRAEQAIASEKKIATLLSQLATAKEQLANSKFISTPQQFSPAILTRKLRVTSDELLEDLCIQEQARETLAKELNTLASESGDLRKANHSKDQEITKLRQTLHHLMLSEQTARDEVDRLQTVSPYPNRTEASRSSSAAPPGASTPIPGQ
eukprot:TRINITY_DN11409_c0_g2_i1.p1 TRINITY_DN11409_c0_g2~~TRINITY_DN11409_c0_g2_i1.p1  ORF type:complete len:851 (-),score=228.96 TRINITY_DN11409_c0_g2_i1:2126-4360(-)